MKFLSPIAIGAVAAFSLMVPSIGLAANQPQNVCHNGHTLSVNYRAAQQHLSHGDDLGPCL